jgi:hypothetical protein
MSKPAMRQTWPMLWMTLSMPVMKFSLALKSPAMQLVQLTMWSKKVAWGCERRWTLPGGFSSDEQCGWYSYSLSLSLSLPLAPTSTHTTRSVHARKHSGKHGSTGPADRNDRLVNVRRDGQARCDADGRDVVEDVGGLGRRCLADGEVGRRRGGGGSDKRAEEEGD